MAAPPLPTITMLSLLADDAEGTLTLDDGFAEADPPRAAGVGGAIAFQSLDSFASLPLIVRDEVPLRIAG